jgi:oleandomycin transport system ATP-binding protein
VPQAVRRLDELGLEVEDVGVRESSLDDVFFALTGRGLEADEDHLPSPARGSEGSADRQRASA